MMMNITSVSCYNQSEESYSIFKIFQYRDIFKKLAYLIKAEKNSSNPTFI